jgi:hypothetical protein
VTHRDATQRRAAEVHDPGRYGDPLLADGPVGKELIVFLGDRDDRVAQRQRHLRQGEEHGADE